MHVSRLLRRALAELSTMAADSGRPLPALTRGR